LKVLDQFHLLGEIMEKSCAGDENVKTATGSEGCPERIAPAALSKISSSTASLSARIWIKASHVNRLLLTISLRKSDRRVLVVVNR
jgi:hypothetical protein